ncbi:MAG: recombination protein RecR [Candidatus Doudnabacteria bacterium RIFCSPHIGHO2_02_FULL_42_25]|uniref:Recombination protein RecR n=1 Tax=Candidatus Doudnabacteria bacterium RIFCSPHIGHO2_01_FULL_41_86 TaxID=1817821 RepID=A0A1F5N9P0_9BACT|nr:MAG: recombination protein RecR [Candidatus Doudnabacteria bacterium RIFCSPHIGHO2_01_FULL_41_86]OGE74854.1 MAG: recombination protein RecR [Candidatus Doudnabacteria bacterium RIFCSPHIGHO2_01_43_10]OGE85198.1 MAG: recombination protein RecR [Candidatus Doudnabacteria bacterium RIFCSPHIGHO2_12_FULL_42_22]OGE86736.1 MAG: recombination protein RecR [Candidatus Doudnabacteria bacterium RIFCSPHIGHO2_02_FULL_42_25]OGE92334.1 MAG: recombination protein RecR [Candidatus Doudnabacteria bacterium RIFC
MSTLPKSIHNLINEFSKLPGIGPKSASRLTFYLLKNPEIDLQGFSTAIANLKKDVIYCSTCFNMAETSPCKICSDPKRDQKLICVVEDALDVVAMDQIADFNGVYHVLGGVISPLNGVSPENLKIKELLNRLEQLDLGEIVLATNPSLEGEATAMYITKQIKIQNSKFKNIKNIKITRIARGLPTGADLEYADEYTLSKALEGRREY